VLQQSQRRNFLLFGAQASWHAALWSAGRSDSPPAWANVITDKSTPASSPHQVPPASWLRAAAINKAACSRFDVFLQDAQRVWEARELRGLSLTWRIACFSPRCAILVTQPASQPLAARKSRDTFCACSWRAARRRYRGTSF
jgi:hypothetical protein